MRVILTLRLIGFNRVNRTNFAEPPRFHSFRALTYTARSLLQPQFEIDGDLRLRSVRAVCVFAHSASDFDTDTDSTSLMTPCPAAGRQETLPFKTIASAHQANEVAKQMH